MNEDRNLKVDAEVESVIGTGSRVSGLTANGYLRRVLGLRDLEDKKMLISHPQPAATQKFPWMSEIQGDSYLANIANAFNECLEGAVPEVRFGPRTQSGMYVASPNFVTLKVQPRAQNLRISVYGPLENLPNGQSIAMASTRHPYASFLFDIGTDRKLVTEIIKRANSNKSRNRRN